MPESLVHTELPFGAQVSGTAPASRTFIIDATASFVGIDAHASSIAFKTCRAASPQQHATWMEAMASTPSRGHADSCQGKLGGNNLPHLAFIALCCGICGSSSCSILADTGLRHGLCQVVRAHWHAAIHGGKVQRYEALCVCCIYFDARGLQQHVQAALRVGGPQSAERCDLNRSSTLVKRSKAPLGELVQLRHAPRRLKPLPRKGRLFRHCQRPSQQSL